MSDQTASEQTATEALDRLEQRYAVRFAGRPRVTRDPEVLEGILADLEQIGADAPASLADRIAGLRKVYSDEILAINAARSQPFAVQAARLRMWADLTYSRYDRSFAGRDRRTRDPALLEELMEDLTVLRSAVGPIHEQAPGLQMDLVLAQIERGIGMYQREAGQIRDVRRQGTLPEQGSRLATLANEQFAVYTRGFAKQSRLSRHPRTLARIVSALEEIRRAMQSLQLGGFADPNNDRNLRIVEDRLRAFRLEQAEIRKAQEAAELGTRVSALAAAANEIADTYRQQFAGKPREAVDPEVLVDLFERLWSVAREMDALDGAHDDETNGRNLQIVTDNLQMYAEEYRRILESRQPAPAATDA
jgi:hypothetical protein